MKRFVQAAALALAALISASARAEVRDGLSLVDSSTRDAPVFEYAVGPRAQLSLGHELRLLHVRRLSLLLTALAAIEDARGANVVPSDLGRLVATVPLRMRYVLNPEVPSPVVIAWEISAGAEVARKLGGMEAEEIVGTPQPGDIAFGGGGTWTGFALALLAPAGPGELRALIRERVFIGGWPLLLGRRDWSASITSFGGEGLSHSPAIDLTWSAPARREVDIVASLFAELLVPIDRSADPGGFARLLAGPAFRGERGTWTPFVSVDVGRGKGLLVNRNEVRFSLGVRHAY